MLYIHYFEYAAAFFTLIIWIVFLSRRSSFTTSSRYFSLFCFVAFMTAAMDVVSAYTISYARIVPLWVNYLFSTWYYFSYICALLVFVLYADSIAKIGAIKNLVHYGIRIVVMFEFVICVTTPWTHLIIYFDENYSYRKGLFYAQSYVLGTLAVILSLIIIKKGRSRFSSFQRRILFYFCLGLLFSTVLQLIFPNVLLAGFNLSVIGFFLYTAFENPAYYFFKDTPCLNYDAFVRCIKYEIKSNVNFSMVVGRVKGYDDMTQGFTTTQKDNFNRRIAGRLCKEFKRDVFLLSNDKFAIRVKNSSEDLSVEKEIETRINKIFEKSIDLYSLDVKIKVFTAIIPSKYKFKTLDELEGVIDLLLVQSDGAGMDTHEKVINAIENKHRRDMIKRVVKKAINNDGFAVYYQPIYNVNTGKFDSAEALVRLIDDEVGFISPEEFIPITEENGLIDSIGEIVLRKVCKFINELGENKMGLRYLEINLSPVQCQKEGIEKEVLSIVKECEMDTSMINFEITETAEAEFSTGSDIVKNIHRLSEAGFSFSIDDFGTGFAAVDHLFAVPFDLVKVDKNILWQAMDNPKAMIVLKNTFRMVKELNKKILVEGVESEEMVNILVENECDYLQGFYFSKPMPENDFIDFIGRKNIA